MLRDECSNNAVIECTMNNVLTFEAVEQGVLNSVRGTVKQPTIPLQEFQEINRLLSYAIQ